MKQAARGVREPEYYFFVGTNAELIKMMPVVRRFREKGLRGYFIASGQNYPLERELLSMSGVDEVDLQLSDRGIAQYPLALVLWFASTFIKGLARVPRFAAKTAPGRPRVMVVIGDTISTIMGAVLGRLFRFQVVHIEAGLRSGNLMRPFPEEITRNLTSILATADFCPNEEATRNIPRRGALKVNTSFNTQLDAVGVALDEVLEGRERPPAGTDRYFILVVHRQENIYNREFLAAVVDKAVEASKNMRCVFVLHEPTERALRQYGLLERVEACDTISVLPRQNFTDFVRILSGCEWLLTDGGGNQQEAYYLGIPCLLLRTETEGPEGLGENALLFGGDLGAIDRFMEDYESFRRPRLIPERRPSDIIVEALTER